MYQSHAKKLRHYAERIESLESEKVGLQDDIKEVYNEVKASGFKPKVLKAAIKQRKASASERQAAQDEIDLYLSAIDGQMDLFAVEPTIAVTATTTMSELESECKGLRRKSATAELTH
jgi:uncharacterized protein (UPF0335 family)